MNKDDHSLNNPDTVIDTCRAELTLRQETYRTAAARYGRLLQVVDPKAADPECVSRARQDAARALEEYTRVLRLFTALDETKPEETLVHGESA